MSDMNIAIAGAGGRMGRILIEAVLAAPDARLAGALIAPAAAISAATRPRFSGQPAGVPWRPSWRRAWPVRST
jgi:4-hydroxy-tetrahydrodipicolinate reductase